ncbi:hypothetical protein ACFX2J_035484 [Malus domestica]
MREPTDLFGGKQLVRPVPAHLSHHRKPRKYRQPSNSPLILILPRLLHLLICDCDPSRFHLFDSESRISLYLGNEFLENLQIQDTQKPGKESPKPKSLESLRQRGTEHPDPSPQKSETLTHRARNSNFALSIGDIRRPAAKSVGDLTQKRRTDQIDPWGVETPKRTCVSRQEKLPEK